MPKSNAGFRKKNDNVSTQISLTYPPAPARPTPESAFPFLPAHA